MQQLLNVAVNGGSLEWKREREQGKLVRKEETDVIKEFVEYATAQGSKSAFRYYSNITKMTNSALGFTAKANPNLKDTLDIMEHSHLRVVEGMVRRKLGEYMKLEYAYKDIYQLIKKDVMAYAEMVDFRPRELK